MAGGAPIPIPVSDSGMTILSIADLKEAASKKLPKSARGNPDYVSYGLSFLCTKSRKAFEVLKLRSCLDHNVGILSRRSLKVERREPGRTSSVILLF